MSIEVETITEVPRQGNILSRLIWAIASRFGGKAKEIERFLKFLVVGSLGAAIDLGVLNLLQSTILPPSGSHEVTYVRLATSTAFVAAVSSNFVWNRYWTYPDSRSRPIVLQLIQFFAVNATAVAFRLILVGLTYGVFGDLAREVARNTSWEDETANQIGTNIAQAIAMVVAMFWNFFVNRYWTYGDVD
jgi:putative flippase GtrA